MPADELVRRYEERGLNPAATPGAPDPSKLWNLDTVRARQAWALMGGIDNIDWGSVRIGHLDTGYTEHEVFGPWTNGFSPSLLPQVGINTFDGWQGTMDPLSPKGTPGHGTRTCSVLTGRRDNVFLGVAPRVPVVPYRVTDFVVIDTLGWQNRIGQAINHAVLDGGCTILSISLGDPCYAPSEMGVAVDAAYERGVIIVAAAGNYTSEVTYPGRYSRTIAAGGITKRDEPWSAGSRGVSVDLCAPAADVWRADPIRNNDGSVTTSRYGDNGDGTSYATVHVSGAAALWKAHHGSKARRPLCGQALAICRGVPESHQVDGTQAGRLERQAVRRGHPGHRGAAEGAAARIPIRWSSRTAWPRSSTSDRDQPPRSAPRLAPRAGAGARHRATAPQRRRLRSRLRRAVILPRHRLQARDALLHRRMGREQAAHAAGRQRIVDIEMRGRRIGLGRRVGDRLRALVQALQRRGEPQRIAGDLRARPVGLVLAAAADRHLHQRGGERRQDHRADGDDRLTSGRPFSSRPPPNRPPKLASMPIAPDRVAATVMVSVSRFLTWPSSCASTPVTSSRRGAAAGRY